MRAKKQDSSDDQWLLLMCAVLFIPFFITAIRHYKRMCNSFPMSGNSQRIFDTMNLIQPLSAGSAVVFFTLFFAFGMKDWSAAILAVPLIALVGVWLSCLIARWVAASYFGVMVDPANDRVLLPKDMASYGIPDYLHFQFIRDLGQLDVIHLSSITKITREAGKRLYIHGPFGSRGIAFSNKQKRDECLAAIEHSAKGVRRVTDFGY